MCSSLNRQHQERWVNFIKGVNITDSFDNENEFGDMRQCMDKAVKYRCLPRRPGSWHAVGWECLTFSSVRNGPRPKSHRSSPLTQAYSENGPARLSYFLMAWRMSLDVPSHWHLLMAAPRMLRDFSFIWAGVWYVTSWIHNWFWLFFNLGKYISLLIN